jgi:hypothetical protein
MDYSKRILRAIQIAKFGLAGAILCVSVVGAVSTAFGASHLSFGHELLVALAGGAAVGLAKATSLLG